MHFLSKYLLTIHENYGSWNQTICSEIVRPLRKGFVNHGLKNKDRNVFMKNGEYMKTNSSFRKIVITHFKWRTSNWMYGVKWLSRPGLGKVFSEFCCCCYCCCCCFFFIRPFAFMFFLPCLPLFFQFPSYWFLFDPFFYVTLSLFVIFYLSFF